MTENGIESFAIELRDKLGYEYICLPHIVSFPYNGGAGECRGGLTTRDAIRFVLSLKVIL